MTHDPGIDVREHRVRQAVGAGIRLKRDAKAPRPERRDVLASVVEGSPSVPGAVDDQDGQVAARLDPAERPQANRKPAIDRDDAGKPLGICQAEPVGERSAFTAADQEDPLGMNVEQPTRLQNGREAGFLEPVKSFGLGVMKDPPNQFAFRHTDRVLRLATFRMFELAPQPNPTSRSPLVTISGPRSPSAT